MPASSFDVSGMLPVYKPIHMVSKDVSRVLTRSYGKLRMGHVGTLDPAADGVLPILLGRATKVQDLLLDLPKTYEFSVKFGVETDSLDFTGQLVREMAWEHITRQMLIEAASGFVGRIKQIPPLFSAVKYKGQALYEFAHQGEQAPVALEELSREVEIFDLHLLESHGNTAKFKVVCSKGTYVRVLAKDIATSLVSCATVTQLTRTNSAGVRLEHALRLDELPASLEQLSDLLIPIEKLQLPFPSWRVPDEQYLQRLKNGQRIVIDQHALRVGLIDAGERPGNDNSHGEKNGVSLTDGEISSVLLEDLHGQAFGLGHIQNRGHDRMILSMKRGL